MNYRKILDFLIFLYILAIFLLKHTKSKRLEGLPLDTMWEIGVIAFILMWFLGW
ncbi:hypothetical protein [Thermococcus thioreducens]|uniref:Uncharacterized protein n=1 Tax=Thermococcus thioreducens TaxID=277988 RepID=A0A1I0NSR4_9EURY|nr:hypothetical protein [Thermococcus thioreducens]SEW04484.1 hypothetical protein SAMN05216170_1223 [Thermococcus thioreducens]